MSMDPYTQPKRALTGGFDTRFELGAAAVTQTLISAKTTVPPELPLYHAVHVQRLKVIVKTGSAGITWQFGNSAPNATDITPPLDMSTAGAVFSFGYGPQGVKLHAGSNLKVTMSGAGAAADVYIEGFQERTNDPI